MHTIKIYRNDGRKNGKRGAQRITDGIMRNIIKMNRNIIAA